MKIMFVDKFGAAEQIQMDDIPRIGDKIGIFRYLPAPAVTDVLWFPWMINKDFPMDINVLITVE